MTMSVHQYLCLTDNYGALIHDSTTGATACVDAPEAGPTFAALAERGWTLSDVLLTHHHADHIQGVPELKAKFPNLRVWGPAKDAARIPFLDQRVVEGDFARVGSLAAKVIETPGHTLGHIAYYFDEDRIAFCGDTLFSLGCGRVFETPYPVMWSSLVKLAALPGETQVYCGHEYTQANGRFAVTIEPDNPISEGPGRRGRAAARGRAPDLADDDRRRARRQSVPAGRGSVGSGRGRHDGSGSGGGVRGNPRAQGPLLKPFSSSWWRAISSRFCMSESWVRSSSMSSSEFAFLAGSSAADFAPANGENIASA